MQKYLIYWHLYPNPNKTTVTALHLSNSMANKNLQISFHGKPLKNKPFPKYLGVTLDHSLTFCKHLKWVTKKFKPKVNIIQKLVGTSCGSSAHTLCTASIASVYSAAEQYSPVWAGSSQTKHLDTPWTNQSMDGVI